MCGVAGAGAGDADGDEQECLIGKMRKVVAFERKTSCFDFTRYGMLWHGYENVQRTNLVKAKEQRQRNAYWAFLLWAFDGWGKPTTQSSDGDRSLWPGSFLIFSWEARRDTLR